MKLRSSLTMRLKNQYPEIIDRATSRDTFSWIGQRPRFVLKISENSSKILLPKLIKEKFRHRIKTLSVNPRLRDFIILLFFSIVYFTLRKSRRGKFIESNFKRLLFIITGNNTICSPKRRENSCYIRHTAWVIIF